MTFLIRDIGGNWREPAEIGYSSESSLQSIIAEHPSLLPEVSTNAVSCREFYSAAGPIDVITVDTNGAITVVECKLATNPQSRREIVGQVMDYASRLWQLDVDEFDRLWSKASGKSLFVGFLDEEDRVHNALMENLATGRFNLILAVDRINEDLKRITEYLNSITLPSVGVMLAEFTHATEGELEILSPRFFGADIVDAKMNKDTARKSRWTPELYLEWCNKFDPENETKAAAFIAALNEAGFYVGRGSASTPSLNCGITSSNSSRRWPIAMYTSEGRGAIFEVRFSDFKNQPEIASKMIQNLSEIPKIAIPLDEVKESGYSRRPNILLGECSLEALEQIPFAVSRAFES